MTLNERLQDRYKALADRKKLAKGLREEIEQIAKKIQQGAKFVDHRDRLQKLALDSGECDYWIQEIEKQIDELQNSAEVRKEAVRLCNFTAGEGQEEIEQHTPLDDHLAILGRR